jgi:hypothetical protein
MAKVFKKPGLDQAVANVSVQKALTVTEKVFGIHRSEFLNNPNPWNKPAYKAKSWFLWSCLDLYELPTQNVVATGYISYERMNRVVNIIRDSSDRDDVRLAKKMREVMEEVEELCQTDQEYLQRIA